MNKYKKYKAFTLVEVLICVGIIGIIAAITIPAILSSTSEKALQAQRKALQSRMSQAFAQIKNLKSYESGATNSALTFISDGLTKVYKISNTCTKDDLAECGIPTSIDDFYSDTLAAHNFDVYAANSLYKLNQKLNTDAMWGGLDTSVAGFKTANGESILLYYNPKCKSKKETKHKLTESVCVNMIYDLNGAATAPNAYGEDIGYITVFYPTDSNVVAPILYNKESFTGTYSQMLTKAEKLDMITPTLEELTAILINRDLNKIVTNAATSDQFWSSTYATTGTDATIWLASIDDGADTDAIDEEHSFFLIKK